MSASPSAATAESAPARAATIALVGRPNAGKSSLYNRLTGGSARVGNYPGITVDVLEADVELPSGTVVTLADLPGLYSVAAAVGSDTDEAIAGRFVDRIREAGPFVVVQVVDPTRLALGLRLTRELLEAKLPLLLVLTHKDVLSAEGRELDIERLSAALGVPTLLVNAREPSTKDTVLAAIDDRLRDPGTAGARASFDPGVLAREVLRDVAQAEASANRLRRLTERLDTVLLHPVLGPVLFIGLMTLVFAAVFLVADPVSGAFDSLLAIARARLAGVLGEGLGASFVVDGVLGGAGTVLAFMPQIVILTIALELLEASGYLARGAFLVDRLLGVLGLSGRSFVPLLMGHACAIPAISSTRVIRDPRERLTTILVLPLMTCSARLPTYALILAAFFSDRSAFFRASIFVGLYFAGILAALVASWVLRRTATKGKSLPLVLEMPAYRVPQANVIARKAYDASRRFLRDVGTVIVAASIALWMLLSIPMPGATRPEGAPPIESSIAGAIGRAAEPITRPAGFDWRVNVGLIGSFGARELMVATMGVVYGLEDVEDDAAPLAEKLREAKHPDGSPVYGPRMGLALLAFFVLACQCMSTVAAIRRATSSWRWPMFVVAYTYALGYAAAVIVYQLGALLGVP